MDEAGLGSAPCMFPEVTEAREMPPPESHIICLGMDLMIPRDA